MTAPLDLDGRVLFPLLVVGVLVSTSLAYYTGQTGDPLPLMAAVAGLSTLLILTSDFDELTE